MATKTFFATNTLLGAAAPKWGELAESSPGATATSSPVMGWTVGTATPTKYKDADAGNVRSAPTSATEAPDVTINNGGGTNNAGWRSKEKLKGKFAAGKWAFHMPCIATVKGGSQDFAIMVKLWKGSNEAGTGATAINGAPLTCSTLTNLEIGAQQDSTAELELPELDFSAGEYLFIEVAVKIVGAGSEATCDCVFRYGNEGVRVTTTNFSEGGGKVVELAGAVTSSSSLSGKLNANRALAGSTASSSSLSGKLNASRILTGALVSSSSLMGSLTVESKAAAAAPAFVLPPRATLTVAVITASGVSYRWGPDEWAVINIPQSISFSTAIPGGFDTCTMVLPRRIDQDYPDLNLLDTIQILGTGNKIVWEGRIQQLPRSHGDAFTITVGAVGWSSHLMDDPAFRQVYVDRDLSNWKPPSSARQIALRAAVPPFSPLTPETAPDAATGLPSLQLKIEGEWNGVTPAQEATYDSGAGLRIAKMYADWVLSTTDSNFVLHPFSADDDVLSNLHVGADLATGVTSGSGLYEMGGGPQRVVGWSWYFSSNTAGGKGAQYTATIRRLALFGDHGLPLRGPANELGVSASDVIGHAVSKAAPLLNLDIEATNFPIPHLVFRDPTTVNEAVEKANAYHRWEWGVWEDRTFFFREPSSTRLCWEARLSDGARLDLEGTQAADVYNGVFVSYPNAAGEQKSAGPIGSGADTEDARLENKSESNPANSHGIPAKWGLLPLSAMTTPAGAVQLGQVYLGEKALPQRRGSLTITGTARHPTAGDVPAYEVRAGDYVRISDHPNDIPRRIIATSYDHESQSITLTLDNSSQKADAILEWVGVGLVGKF